MTLRPNRAEFRVAEAISLFLCKLRFAVALLKGGSAVHSAAGKNAALS
jgi:hypothetical protein